MEYNCEETKRKVTKPRLNPKPEKKMEYSCEETKRKVPKTIKPEQGGAPSLEVKSNQTLKFSTPALPLEIFARGKG